MFAAFACTGESTVIDDSYINELFVFFVTSLILWKNY